VDSNAAKYVTIQKVQASRQELISDLQMMTKVRAIQIRSDLGVNCIVLRRLLLVSVDEIHVVSRGSREGPPLEEGAEALDILSRCVSLCSADTYDLTCGCGACRWCLGRPIPAGARSW
jgi:hypothetical protein